MAFGLLPDTLFIALLTSTILAGLRRSSGLTFQTQQLLSNPTGVKVFSVYLSAGEWVCIFVFALPPPYYTFPCLSYSLYFTSRVLGSYPLLTPPPPQEKRIEAACCCCCCVRGLTCVLRVIQGL